MDSLCPCASATISPKKTNHETKPFSQLHSQPRRIHPPVPQRQNRTPPQKPPRPRKELLSDATTCAELVQRFNRRFFGRTVSALLLIPGVSKRSLQPSI